MCDQPCVVKSVATIPSMPTQRKIQVIAKEIDLGTPKHNVVITDIDHVTFDFFVVPIYLL